MAVDKARVGRIAMELMDDLEKNYPEGEIEGVVVCAVVRRHRGAERRVAWVAEPADRELVRGALYTALGMVDEAAEDEGGGGP